MILIPRTKHAKPVGDNTFLAFRYEKEAIIRSIHQIRPIVAQLSERDN